MDDACEDAATAAAAAVARGGRAPDRVLVTVAGDFLSPSLLAALDRGAGMVDCLNALGCTHVCFGNHEADLPLAATETRAREFGGVWLNSNLPGFPGAAPLPPPAERDGGAAAAAAADALVLDAEPAAFTTRPFDVVDLGDGARVALLGLLLDAPGALGGASKKAGGGAAFRGVPVEPPRESAAAVARYLRGSGGSGGGRGGGVSAIVALTHQSLEDDLALAADDELNALGLVCVLGGHEHDVIAERAATGARGARGGCRVLKAGSDATHATVVDLTITPPPRGGGGDGARVSVAHAFVQVTSLDADAALAARVEGHLECVAQLREEVVVDLSPLAPPPSGSSGAPPPQRHRSARPLLSSEGARRRETSMGQARRRRRRVVALAFRRARPPRGRLT